MNCFGCKKHRKNQNGKKNRNHSPITNVYMRQHSSPRPESHMLSLHDPCLLPNGAFKKTVNEMASYKEDCSRKNETIVSLCSSPTFGGRTSSFSSGFDIVRGFNGMNTPGVRSSSKFYIGSSGSSSSSLNSLHSAASSIKSPSSTKARINSMTQNT